MKKIFIMAIILAFGCKKEPVEYWPPEWVDVKIINMKLKCGYGRYWFQFNGEEMSRGIGTIPKYHSSIVKFPASRPVHVKIWELTDTSYVVLDSVMIFDYPVTIDL